MTNELKVPMNVKQGTLEAVVIRCGCGDPNSHFGEVCPKGIREDHGVVSYYHRNPLRRWAWEFNQQYKLMKERIKKWKESKSQN